MNTQTRSQRLLAGEALQLPQRTAHAVLTQGEVLVQPPAQWLGGVLVVPAVQRLVAPALLPMDDASVQALTQAVVLVQESPSPVAVLTSWVARLRSAVPARNGFPNDKPA